MFFTSLSLSHHGLKFSPSQEMYVGTETRASEVSGRPRLYRQWELSLCRRDTLDGVLADTLTLTSKLELSPSLTQLNHCSMVSSVDCGQSWYKSDQ